VSVKDAAKQVQDRDGETAEDLPIHRLDDQGRLDKGAFRQIVPVIPNDGLAGSPPRLELPETVVLRLCPAEAQGTASVIAPPPDCLPHDQVIRAQMLKGPVRGSVFVEERLPEVKIDIGGNGGAAGRGQNDKAHPLRKDAIIDIPKKTARLGRQAMVSAGKGVEPAKVLHGFGRDGDGDFDPLLFRLSNVPPCGIPKARENFAGSGCEVEGVAVVPFGGRLVREKGLPTPYFQILPLPLFAEIDRSGKQLLKLRTL